jgi:hypothetical protein
MIAGASDSEQVGRDKKSGRLGQILGYIRVGRPLPKSLLLRERDLAPFQLALTIALVALLLAMVWIEQSVAPAQYS